LLGAFEESSARKVARERAESVTIGTDTDAQAEYNKALIEWMVARSICDPNDIAKNHKTFPAPEDTLAQALTLPALTRLFDELERYHVESSQIFAEADDDQIESLIAVLDGPEPFAALAPVHSARVRRYLAYVLDELTK
jgi:hypothetical protein